MSHRACRRCERDTACRPSRDGRSDGLPLPFDPHIDTETAAMRVGFPVRSQPRLHTASPSSSSRITQVFLWPARMLGADRVALPSLTRSPRRRVLCPALNPCSSLVRSARPAPHPDTQRTHIPRAWPSKAWAFEVLPSRSACKGSSSGLLCRQRKSFYNGSLFRVKHGFTCHFGFFGDTKGLVSRIASSSRLRV